MQDDQHSRAGTIEFAFVRALAPIFSPRRPDANSLASVGSGESFEMEQEIARDAGFVSCAGNHEERHVQYAAVDDVLPHCDDAQTLHIAQRVSGHDYVVLIGLTVLTAQDFPARRAPCVKVKRGGDPINQKIGPLDLPGSDSADLICGLHGETPHHAYLNLASRYALIHLNPANEMNGITRLDQAYIR